MYLKRTMKCSLAIFICIVVSLSVAQLDLQMCNNCTECNGGLGQYNGLCKCDGSCDMYGDCCQSPFNLGTCGVNNAVPTGVEFVCRSIYLDSRIEPQINESFWMVSSCPSSWPSGASQNMVKENCVSLSSSLPPVTDLTTGMVYANEFCAICNGIENLIAWQPNLACTQYVYDQLAASNNNIQQLLQNDPTIFQTQCQACSYQIPQNSLLPPPRPCFSAINKCANRSHLESVTETTYSRENYTALVDSCENGPYDIVTHVSFSAVHIGNGVYNLILHNRLYRNRACAVCNGVEYQFCFHPLGRDGVPQECAPMIPATEAPTTDPTTEPTTTEPPTTVPTTPPTTLPRTTVPLTTETFKPPEEIIVTINGTNFTFVVNNVVSGLDLPVEEVVPRVEEIIVEEIIVDQGFIIDEDPLEPLNNGIPFTITLSNLGGGQVEVSVMSESVRVAVNCPEGEAAIGLECRPTLCPAGYAETGGRCAFQINNNNSSSGEVMCLTDLVALNSSDYIRVDNETVSYENLIVRIIEFDSSGRPVVCPNNATAVGILINCPIRLVALNDSEYTDLGNDTVMLGDEIIDVIEYDGFGRPLICPPNETTIIRNTTVYSYPTGYFILTYIGCSLSVIGSALVLLTYGIFKDLRTLPSLILMNVAAAILMNNLFILIGGPVTQAFPSLGLCATVAICLHFFFLAQFAWMSIMSFQMARTFYQARKLKINSKGNKKKVLAFYSLFGWGVPLLIVATSIIVNFATDHLVLYGVLADGTLGSCWINHLESAIVAFVVPLVVSLVFNMVLFVIVTVFLIVAYRSHAKVNKNQNLPFFRVNVAVFSVTGLTWVFGFIAILAGTSWAWYPFIVFNSTQGFVIFIVFLLTKRVLKLYLNLLLRRKPVVSSKTNKSVLGDQPPSPGTVKRQAMYTVNEPSKDIQNGSIDTNPV